MGREGYISILSQKKSRMKPLTKNLKRKYQSRTCLALMIDFLWTRKEHFNFSVLSTGTKTSEPKKTLPWTVNYGSLGDDAVCPILSTWLLFTCQKTSSLVHKWKRNNISLKTTTVIFVMSSGKWKCFVSTKWSTYQTGDWKIKDFILSSSSVRFIKYELSQKIFN